MCCFALILPTTCGSNYVIIKTAVHNSPAWINIKECEEPFFSFTMRYCMLSRGVVPSFNFNKPAICTTWTSCVTVFVWKQKANVFFFWCSVCQQNSAWDDNKIGGLNKSVCEWLNRKAYWKKREMSLCYSDQAIWIFPVWSLDLGLFIVKYNHCLALQRCWQQQVQADSFSVANYHPRKVGIHCSDITRWCHALICIWIKLLNRSRINRGRAQQQALFHFSHWLTLPHSAWAVSLCVHYRDTRSAVHGEASWSDLFGWDKKVVQMHVDQVQHLVPNLLPDA